MSEIAAAIALIAIAVSAITFVVNVDGQHKLRQEAIERGFAQYCPADGRWAWKGECDE